MLQTPNRYSRFTVEEVDLEPNEHSSKQLLTNNQETPHPHNETCAAETAEGVDDPNNLLNEVRMSSDTDGDVSNIKITV